MAYFLKIIIVVTSISITTVAIARDILIPRSVSGDKGRYFLLEKKKQGNIVSALHKRIGVDSIGYTRTETNCTTMKMRELGYSEEGIRMVLIQY